MYGTPLNDERPAAKEAKGIKFPESISQKWLGYKEKTWIFDEISVNSTLLCPPAMVY
jgi:hypothetical protein